MAHITRTICFFNPSISREEAIGKIWKQEEAIFKVTVFEGELVKEYGNPLWARIREMEEIMLIMYNQFSPYWAIFENNEFMISSY